MQPKVKTVYIAVPSPEVYIPAAPYPKELTVEFYDYNKKAIPPDASDDTLVGYWLIPDWYAKVVIDYMSEVEKAAQILEEAKRPP